ncbi:MAG: PorP/SprF family type IX secretion system membrane protein [Bacteroidales bacterium]|nr:PorP/SprF family type IX secretion system membrane protein [Bacteroidales bacterium]
MKRIAFLVLILLVKTDIYGQQFPFMEGYNMNPFSMSPAYAGLCNPKTVFVDYRSDWVGVEGGPVTYQLSYNDRLFKRVGIGGRFIYDMTDIFKQTIILGTYTYEVRLMKYHSLHLGLSAGMFRNSIDLAKYYSDPGFVADNVLLYGFQESKIKFATDFSALYRYRDIEAGILFSNVMFGSARYNSSDIAYKPTKNYLVNLSYNYNFDRFWALKPFVMLRGGQNYPVQLELASQISYDKSYWGTAVFRTGGVWGLGLGGEIIKGVLLNYSYNFSSNVSLNSFGSHQVTLGVRLTELGSSNQKTGIKHK